MDKKGLIRQIILVSDGESNVGINPIEVSKKAKELGITVSTIGIVNNRTKEKPLAEIQQIANQGGGIWEITDLENFSKTMEMLTVKTVHKTIQEAVNKELKNILGEGLEDFNPESRRKIIDVIDKFGEEIDIRCCIVIDLSGSMTNKISIAKKSIVNLLRTLKQRKGKTEIAVIGFPGTDYEFYKIICDFTEDIDELQKSLSNIATGGTTPTGPALKRAVEMLLGTAEVNKGMLAANIV
ncbi:vWA domain-containing protein [Caloranaerobacter azorensis]|uniref:VWA domain-containing protein n=1 Tax=Caloranaerobacter azorensis TaxID=116090 RepID=A0A6P1YFC0_9FIRM|nr:VWA domain-containing protein [Caloranaerobacter azorensis]QIB28059.1 VWA domain-containing protein [Caloranaerobacter azorensis]